MSDRFDGTPSPSTERSLGIIPKPSDRSAWLAARWPWYNASAAAVLFNRHPFMTPGDYATNKLTGYEPRETRAMARGTRLEDVIAQWWAEENGCEVTEPDVLYVTGRMMATVDRIVTVPSFDAAEGLPVEIKTTAHHRERPEPHWLYQCQAILACTGQPELALVWFDSSLDIRTQFVEADTALQDDMLERAERFMAAIDLGFAPDWIELSADNIAAIYDKPAEGVDLDRAGLDVVREYAAVRQVRLEAEADEAKLKDRMARLMLNREVALFEGLPVLSWKSVKGGTYFDAKRFERDHPDLFEQYTSTKPDYRRFHLLLSGI